LIFKAHEQALQDLRQELSKLKAEAQAANSAKSRAENELNRIRDTLDTETRAPIRSERPIANAGLDQVIV
jgi:hypothetical protein